MAEDLPNLKLVILGESSVGKTALVHRFITNKFDSQTTNTIGAAFITKTYHSQKDPQRRLKLEIWDTAGQERYRSLTPMYYRNAKVALVCFDLSNFDDTFKTAKFWIDQLQLNSSSNAEDVINIRLIGNKFDLIESSTEVDTVEIQKKIDEFIISFNTHNNTNIRYNHTSAKTGSGIQELFDEIIDDIEDDFFTEFQNRTTSTTEGQIGSILDARMNGAPSSTCC
ncbi:small GTPase superfamily [Scheffersomyces coipomensis]|uniref:small GTPase superfamily n=1 Tax=Scheffersomyces coipomensis TaxID=1788519 RepID=UPI00315DBEC3